MSEETKMVAPQSPGKVRLVKIKALQMIRVSDTVQVAPGKTAEVSEEIAAEFCDKVFQGCYDFGGERITPTATRHRVVRAVRVA